MKFIKLDVENFLAISNATVTLDGRGLVLIQGSNEDDTSADSNGAGKSTIADALCWCIYGETARGESGDKIVNRKAGKNTCVALTVADAGDVYLIERFRKHLTGKNSLKIRKIESGGMVLSKIEDLTKGTDKLTQDVVTHIIGSSYEVFRASIYAGQESMPDLPGMTDRNLKMLVEEAAGTTVLEAAYEEARRRLGATKSTFDILSRSVEEASKRAGVLRTDLEVEKDAAVKWEADKITRKKAARDQAVSAAATAKSWIEAIGDKRSTLTASIAAVDAKISAVAGELKKEKELIGNEADAKRALDRAKFDFDSARITAEKRTTAIQSIDHKVGRPCGECGRSYTKDEIAPARDILVRDQKDALEKLRDLKQREEDAHKNATRVVDELSTFRASMTDISETDAQRRSLQAELDKVGALERQRDNAIKDAKRWKSELERIEAETNPCNATIARSEARLNDQLRKIEELESDLKNAEKENTRAVAVVDVFAPAGVRAHILDHVTPFLNAQTSKYLSVLSDGNIAATWSTLTKTAKGELREKFAIEVSSKTGGESFGLISGGEKRKVRISTALALQDLVASRATKPIELFIGDEIDDALDDAGLERLMMILEEKARERGTVLVISHNSLRDWISNMIVVTKKDGASTIEEFTE